MSLTSQLSNFNSVVRRFMHTHFPNVTKMVRAINKEPHYIRPILPPEGVEFQDGGYALSKNPRRYWAYVLGDIGTALDYRIRFNFPEMNIKETIAYRDSLSRENRVKSRAHRKYRFRFIGTDFFNEVEEFLARTRPDRGSLIPEDEDVLCRYCYTMGLIDYGYRNSSPHQNMEWFDIDVNELISRPAQWISDDIAAQNTLFRKSKRDWLSKPATLNPTFTGGVDVGGADADLIVDGCLIDLKSSQKNLTGRHLYQLIGYCLLDYEDEHGIDSLAIYRTRYGVTHCWAVEEMLALSMDFPQPLNELRAKFRKVFQDELQLLEEFKTTPDKFSFLASSNGRKFLEHESRVRLLASTESNKFLKSPEGRQWLISDNGKFFMATIPGKRFLSSGNGRDFLTSPSGRKWLSTDEGRYYLTGRKGREFLNSGKGRVFLASAAGREWLSTTAGRKWLECDKGRLFLTLAVGRNWLTTKFGRKWLVTRAGKIWLTSPDGQVFLISKNGCKWLETADAIDWLASAGARRFLTSINCHKWLVTEAGQNWLDTQGGRSWLASYRSWAFLGNKHGEQWLETIAGRAWIYTDDAKDWLFSVSAWDFLITPAGREWLISDEGKIFLAGTKGHEFLEYGKGRLFLTRAEGREWLTTEDGRKWLSSDKSQTFLKLAVGREWLDTAAGKAWQASTQQE